METAAVGAAGYCSGNLEPGSLGPIQGALGLESSSLYLLSAGITGNAPLYLALGIN